MADRQLTVADHTHIMRFVIINSAQLTQMASGIPEELTAPAILGCAERLTKGDDAARFSFAASEIRDLERIPINPKDQTVRAAASVIAKISLAQGDLQDLATTLKVLADENTGAVQIGLNTALDVLSDGADTIYNPEFWIVEKGISPSDVFFGRLRAAGRKALDAAVDTAVADAAGAVVGGVRGALTGGQAGAVRGAVSGAIAGSVRGGAKPAS